MKCLDCNTEMRVVHENHKYLECGLDNVVIVNATKYKCASCGEEYLDLPNPEVLHKVIAGAVIRNPKELSGPEFRFLRKHLGFSGTYFANVLKVSRETLSRYENGKAKIPKTLDLLIRSLVMNTLPNRDYDYHDLILASGKKPASVNYRIVALKKGVWKEEAIAA